VILDLGNHAMGAPVQTCSFLAYHVVLGEFDAVEVIKNAIVVMYQNGRVNYMGDENRRSD
jgi:hypothetical protein